MELRQQVMEYVMVEMVGQTLAAAAAVQLDGQVLEMALVELVAQE
jgi:hypothetical protein